MVRVGQGSYNYQHAGGGKKPGEIGARLRQEGLTLPMKAEAVQAAEFDVILVAAANPYFAWGLQIIRKGFAGWFDMAKKNEWIKTDE
ncbi:MAG: hypothetical protein WBD79_24850 [Anaerolineae bacterium]